MKNMLKSMKKLKLWPRKRKKKKTHEPYYPPPPCHCFCSHSYAPPSAPPLPPWLEADQSYGTFLAPSSQSIPEAPYLNQAHVPQPEIIVDDTPIYQTLPESSLSYQQYMVRQPVYGMPVAQTARRARSAGAFGCIVNFGVHVFRCLCPCFHIREVV
ncbi:Homeobox protein [Quillaja saponaria]|uniref:Homeobox protein n=1 Tax=Quillaja saponaria TaxID=32244 RepID=A0AAD7M0Y1_QUISA|nr:Homeobox protein [Quillaja saponaria]